MKVPTMLLAAPLAAVLAMAPTSPAAAADSFEKLLERMPDRANALLFVDVDKLFGSPLGQREKWRELAAQPGKDRIGLPAGISRMIVGLGYEFEDSEILWRVGVAEYDDAVPDIKTVAAREAGFVEMINKAEVAWTPRDLYFIGFGPKHMGYATPARRQQMSEWITETFVKPKPFAPGFAARARTRAEGGSPVVLALDLTNTFSPELTTAWLSSQDAITKAKLDPKLVAERLATARSAMIQVDVGQSIEGRLRVEFEGDVSVLGGAAKELVLAALEEAGADIPDLDRWTGGVEGGRAIELRGRLTDDAVRRILSVGLPPQLTPARPSLADAPAPAPDAKPVALSPGALRDDVTAASQGYFRSVADALEGLKRQRPTSSKGMKMWYERTAKQIEELPLLGVDKELLDWGSRVARTLREMAYGINENMQNRHYATASSGGGYYTGYGYGFGGVNNSAQETIRQQGEAMLSVSLDSRWQVLDTTIADMRRKMVEKYGVDF